MYACMHVGHLGDEQAEEGGVLARVDPHCPRVRKLKEAVAEALAGEL